MGWSKVLVIVLITLAQNQVHGFTHEVLNDLVTTLFSNSHHIQDVFAVKKAFIQNKDVQKSNRTLDDLLRTLMDKGEDFQKANDKFTISEYKFNVHGNAIVSENDLAKNDRLLSCTGIAGFTMSGMHSRSQGFLQSITLSGLKTAQYTYTQLTSTVDLPYHFVMNYTWDRFVLLGTYDLNANLLQSLPLYGAGDFILLLNQPSALLDVAISQRDDGLLNVNAGFDFNAGSMQTDIKGLFDVEQVSTFVNSIVSDVGLDAILLAFGEARPLVDSLLTSEVNKLVVQYNVTLPVLKSGIEAILQLI